MNDLFSSDLLSQPVDDELMHFDLPNIGKIIKDLSTGADRNRNKASGRQGGKKDREWKKHKWVSRKRGKDGKWIYDYGDGYKVGKTSKLAIPINKNIQLHTSNPLQKLLRALGGLGKLLFGRSLKEIVSGGFELQGSLTEAAKRLKVAQLKEGTTIDEHGLPIKHFDSGKDADLATVNPGWENKDGYSQFNCPGCSVAYDMRRRGYEVIAKEDNAGLSSDQVVSFYKNPDVKYVSPDIDADFMIPGLPTYQKELGDSVNRALDSEPDGSRGVAWMAWNGGGGHMVAYEVENGQAMLYDAQNGQKFRPSDYAYMASEFAYYRTDNLEPDWEQVKKVVE